MNFQIILMAIMQLAFSALAVAFLVFVVMKADKSKKDARPGIEQEPVLLDSLKVIFKKLPGQSDSDKLVNSSNGTFYTTAELPNVWERVVDTLTRQPVMLTQKYQWKKIQPDQAYRRIQLRAFWTDEFKYVSAAPGISDHINRVDYQFDCQFKFEELAGGGTAIHFQYRLNNEETFLDIPAGQIRNHTNTRLQKICLQLTKDPNSGIPF